MRKLPAPPGHMTIHCFFAISRWISRAMAWRFGMSFSALPLSISASMTGSPAWSFLPLALKP